MDLSDLLKCPVCFEEFDCDVSLFPTDEEKRSSRLPVLSHQCPHKICATCLNSMQLVAMSDQTSAKAKAPKWFKCHTCKEKTAFNAVDIKIDLYACGAIGGLKPSGSISNETQPNRSSRERNEMTPKRSRSTSISIHNGTPSNVTRQETEESKKIRIKVEETDDEKEVHQNNLENNEAPRRKDEKKTVRIKKEEADDEEENAATNNPNFLVNGEVGRRNDERNANPNTTERTDNDSTTTRHLLNDRSIPRNDGEKTTAETDRKGGDIYSNVQTMPNTLRGGINQPFSVGAPVRPIGPSTQRPMGPSTLYRHVNNGDKHIGRASDADSYFDWRPSSRIGGADQPNDRYHHHVETSRNNRGPINHLNAGQFFPNNSGMNIERTSRPRQGASSTDTAHFGMNRPLPWCSAYGRHIPFAANHPEHVNTTRIPTIPTDGGPFFLPHNSPTTDHGGVGNLRSGSMGGHGYPPGGRNGAVCGSSNDLQAVIEQRNWKTRRDNRVDREQEIRKLRRTSHVFYGPSPAGHPPGHHGITHGRHDGHGPMAANSHPVIDTRVFLAGGGIGGVSSAGNGPFGGASGKGHHRQNGGVSDACGKRKKKNRPSRKARKRKKRREAQAKKATDVMMDDLPEFHPVDVPESVEDVGDVSDLDGDEAN